MVKHDGRYSLLLLLRTGPSTLPPRLRNVTDNDLSARYIILRVQRLKIYLLDNNIMFTYHYIDVARGRGRSPRNGALAAIWLYSRFTVYLRVI